MNLLAKVIVEFKTSISCDLLSMRPPVELGRQFTRTFSNAIQVTVRHQTVAPSKAPTLNETKDGDGMWLSFLVEHSDNCITFDGDGIPFGGSGNAAGSGIWPTISYNHLRLVAHAWRQGDMFDRVRLAFRREDEEHDLKKESEHFQKTATLRNKSKRSFDSPW